MSTADLAVVGAGLGGLAAATFARAQGLSVQVVDAAPRPGGRVRTVREDDFVVELGPLGWLDREPEVSAFARLLQLDIVPAESAQKRRWLHTGGRLRELPTGPGSFLTTPLLPLSGKLRFFCEPFIRARREGEESIQDFARRRFGKPMAETFFGAMVSGVFGGDPARLSMHACFPLLAGWEADAGSVTRGALRHMRAKKRAIREGVRPATRGTLCSFAGGMGELVDAAAAQLGDGWMPGVSVDAIQADDDAWLVSSGGEEVLRARSIVIATPAAEAARLLASHDADGLLMTAAEGVGNDSLAVVTLAFPAEAIGADLDGFGFIALRSEGFRPLGVQYASSIFPGQTPRGQVQLRVMVGGAFDPSAIELDDEALASAALDPLREILGIRGNPVHRWMQRVPGGIPQYRLGHLERIATFDHAEMKHRGLYFAGDSLHGVGVNAVVKRAAAVVDRIVAANTPS